MTTSCDTPASTCGGAESTVDEALEPCPKPTYIESRTVYTPAVCVPRVVGGDPAAAPAISTEACNLLQNTGLGLFVGGNVAPSDDGAITWTGCGTPASPWEPTIDYSVLETALDPNDTTAYVTATKCGWEWSGGKLVNRGALITDVVSSDGSLDVSFDPATCTVDVTWEAPVVPTPATVYDAPAEIAIIEATTATVLGQKQVTVTIKHAKDGSTGVISVTPDSGTVPPTQSYTASALGTASKTFNIDTSANTVTITGTNSSRFLINPQANFALAV